MVKKNKRVYTKKRSDKNRNQKSKSLVYFYMDNCGHCNKFSEKLWPKIEKLKNVKTYKINGPKYISLADKFNVVSYPTLIKLNKKDYEVFQEKRTLGNIKKFLH